ncbi:MAG TPA: metallophosphoesterase family protein, partial [Dehalococcoidia bacterium]
MLLIGLISDTHIPEAAPDIWPQVYEAFSHVDLILHAGDLHVLDVVDRLERLAPIYVARGNGDDGGAGRP